MIKVMVMESEHSVCLRCKSGSATFHLTYIIEGQTSKADLCALCARALDPLGTGSPSVDQVLALIREASGKS